MSDQTYTERLDALALESSNIKSVADTLLALAGNRGLDDLRPESVSASMESVYRSAVRVGELVEDLKGPKGDETSTTTERNGGSEAKSVAPVEQQSADDVWDDPAGNRLNVAEAVDSIVGAKGLFDSLRYMANEALGQQTPINPETIFGIGKAGYEISDHAEVTLGNIRFPQ